MIVMRTEGDPGLLERAGRPGRREVRRDVVPRAFLANDGRSDRDRDVRDVEPRDVRVGGVERLLCGPERLLPAGERGEDLVADSAADGGSHDARSGERCVWAHRDGFNGARRARSREDEQRTTYG